jgi:hypothetical protein
LYDVRRTRPPSLTPPRGSCFRAPLVRLATVRRVRLSNLRARDSETSWVKARSILPPRSIDRTVFFFFIWEVCGLCEKRKKIAVSILPYHSHVGFSRSLSSHVVPVCPRTCHLGPGLIAAQYRLLCSLGVVRTILAQVRPTLQLPARSLLHARTRTGLNRQTTSTPQWRRHGWKRSWRSLSVT